MLDPGGYADIALGTRGKLTLSAGEYGLTSLELGVSSKLYLDLTGGPITVYVDGDVLVKQNSDVLVKLPGYADYVDVDQLDAEADVAAAHAGAHGMWFELSGTLQVKTTSDWYGTVYAHHDHDDVLHAIWFGSNSDVVGRLLSAGGVHGESFLHVTHPDLP